MRAQPQPRLTERPPTRTAAVARSEPQEGDVVVERAVGRPIAFTVRLAPDRHAVLTLAKREPALNLGRRFAAAHKVNLWCGEDSGFRLLESFRARRRPTRRREGSLHVVD